MNHFYNNIPGWFDYPDVYNMALDRFGSGIFVELGSWCGKSASYMGVEIINRNKQITLACIDTWEGSEEHKGMPQLKGLYNTFITNVAPIRDIIIPINCLSWNAAKVFGGVSFCFIDAAHDYESVTKDIKAWSDKAEMLAGHDIASPNVRCAVEKAFKYTTKGNCWIRS